MPIHTITLPSPTATTPDAWTTVQLVDATDGSAPEQATEVSLAATSDALWVRFECADRHAWGTYTERDDPLWQEEAVEVFLAPATDEPFPRRYVEVEVSPLGTVFDAIVENPYGDRREMTVDTSWDWLELEAGVEPMGSAEDWRATLRLPWAGVLAVFGLEALPRRWRLNVYRIERPRDGEAEFSAWSPTWVTPADFHRPERFGFLEFG
ncbi:MAG: carbohydrate-binding family 9-like protein [Acidobacteriota bacterium]